MPIEVLVCSPMAGVTLLAWFYTLGYGDQGTQWRGFFLFLLTAIMIPLGFVVPIVPMIVGGFGMSAGVRGASRARVRALYLASKE